MKKILTGQTKATSIDYGVWHFPYIDFAVLTHGNAKKLLHMMLKEFSLLIELKNHRMISATYVGMKMIARTSEDVVLLYDTLQNEELEILLDDIKSVRIFG